MLKSVIVTLCLASLVQAATTSVQDTLFQADGVTRFNGVLRISWGTFQSADGHQNPAGSLISNVNNGGLNQNLEPNDTATPSGTYYTVNYQLSNGANVNECWVVPTSGSPVNLTVVRVSPTVCGTSFPVLGIIPVSTLSPGVAWSFLQTNGTLIPTWEALPVISGLGQHGIPVIEGTSPITSVLPLTNDSVLLWSSTSSDPTASPVPNCGDSTHALSYSTGSHSFGCQGLSGGGGSSPGGVNTSVQFNNSGSFGGDTVFEYSPSTHILSLGIGNNSYGTIELYSNTLGQPANLSISNDTAAAFPAFINLQSFSSSGFGGQISGISGRGSQGSPTSTQGTDILLNLAGYGYRNTALTLGAQIFAQAASNWITGNSESQLVFATTPAGTTSPVNAMVLDSSGHLVIGTTETGSGSSLQVPAQIQFTNNATSQPSCDSTHDGTFWFGASGTVEVLFFCSYNGFAYGWRQII